MPGYDCEEQYIQAKKSISEKSISVKNPSTHFTLKMLVNQRFGSYAAIMQSLRLADGSTK